MAGVIGSGRAPGHQAGYISGSSSDGSISGSEGGAPLGLSSPENYGPRIEAGTSIPKNNSPASSEASQTGDEYRTSQSGNSRNGDAWPRRSFAEKSATRSAAVSIPKTSSIGGPSPALTLAAYPGPGAAKERQPSLPALLPAPSVRGGVQVPGAVPKTSGRGVIPGATTQTFISAMQAVTFNPTDEGICPAHKALRDQICKLQTRVWGLRQGMYSQSEIPQEFLKSFDYDMQELMGNTVKLNKSADALADELKKSHEECKRLQADLRELQHDAQSLKGRQGEFEIEQSRLVKRSSEDMRTIQYLTDQLRQNEMAKMILQDQVEGKRSLWMDVHRDPQERAAAMHSLTRASTPLSGPTIATSMDQSQAYGGRQAGSIRSGSLYSGSIYSGSDHSSGAHYLGGRPQFQTMLRSHSGPGPLPYSGQSQHQRLLSIPTLSGHSSVDFTNDRLSRNTSPIHPSIPKRSPRVLTSAEYGSPNERKRDSSSALVRSAIDNDECKKWADEFQGLFALVDGFCTTYFHELPPIGGDWKSHIQAEANGVLWDYICRVCQPGHEQDRGDRALRLLKDDVCRPYLMQRLIVQHIIVYIFTHEGWKDYSDDVDEEMAKLEANLKTIDPRKTFERQAMIDRRAELVTEMATGPNEAAFKNHKLNQHHQHMKKMVAPFLPRDKKSTVAQEAFYDLFAIAGSAWDVSAKLFRSRLTFQYVWNDAYTRFSAEAHKPVGIELDPMMLQLEHWRVKLCVTPTITMRNDQGMTIATKNILKSGVLVMRY